MPADKKRASLAADIARVLGGKHLPVNNANAAAAPSRCLLMAGVALAVMQAQPAGAVSLGELRVQSGLGQPFVGTTTARLGPGETISSTCVSAPAGGGDGLGSPDGLKVSAQNGSTPGNYPVQIRTTQPLYEPMYEIRLQINCPGGVALSKSYVVMLNLPMSAPVEPVGAPARRVNEQRPVAGTRSQQRPGRPATPARSTGGRLAASRDAIPAGQRYRVRNGDTLSTIAERVDGRPVGSTWRVAEILFAANPDAFIRGNRDMIKLGAVLEIPGVAELSGTAPRETSAPSLAAAKNNDRPAATSNDQVNVTLGRPEESVTEAVSNEELLREIREANLAEANAFADSAAEQSVTTDSKVTTSDAELSADTELSPFADENTTGTAAADTAAADIQPVPATTANVVQDNAANNEVVAANREQSSGMNPLVAALAGIFMGVLLALVMLGRNIVGPLLEGRARRKAALESAAAPTPAESKDETFRTVEVSSRPSRPAYGGGGIDVEIGEAPVAEATSEVDVDLSDDAPEETAPEPNQAPRISLRSGEEDTASNAQLESLLDGINEDSVAEKTSRFEAPPLNTPLEETAEHNVEGMDNTGTMRSLFEEQAHEPTQGEEIESAETVEMADESESATAELPSVDTDDVADIDITDLESLSQKLQETQDDKLSATLTQALGLLEQDYENEMTASQILEQQEVDKAFSQHKAKD